MKKTHGHSANGHPGRTEETLGYVSFLRYRHIRHEFQVQVQYPSAVGEQRVPIRL